VAITKNLLNSPQQSKRQNASQSAPVERQDPLRPRRLNPSLRAKKYDEGADLWQARVGGDDIVLHVVAPSRPHCSFLPLCPANLVCPPR
jgi:hypothetical protein